jgi:hypothetical protein
MKTNPLIWMAAVLGLLLAVVWWQQGDLQDEITQLRAEIAGLSSRPSQSARDNPASGSVSDSSTPIIGVPRAENNEDRIAELEYVVNAQADLLEGLMAQLSQANERHRRASARAWGPEQAVGAPDTMTAGDQRTAWAPANADGGVEWLEAEFADPADLAQVVVRQTCNPGTITKVVAITDTGAEVPIWQGEDPSKGQRLADTPFAVPAGVNARKVKIFLDTSKMPGWEEIDAIKIVGRDGSQQWANSVNASSTYAGGVSMAGDATLYGLEMAVGSTANTSGIQGRVIESFSENFSGFLTVPQNGDGLRIKPARLTREAN